jgi:hypothetical protein
MNPTETDNLMTYNKALDTLKSTRQLRTNLLGPLGIPFENFLRFGQLTTTQQDVLMTKLITHLERFKK